MALDLTSAQTNRLSKLRLSELVNRAPTSEEVQKTLAPKLRELTFKYLKGELRDKISDGPEVEILRKNLNEIGQMDDFLSKQSPDRAWATDLELTLLAELLNMNFAVKMTGGREEPTVLTANPNSTKPTVVLINEHNTHWSAQINGTKQKTLGDGNCGYNAFALVLAEMVTKPAQQNPILLRIRQEEEQRLIGSLKQAEEAASQFEEALEHIQSTNNEQYNAIKKQIDDDYLFALKLMISELPDANGMTQHIVGSLKRVAIQDTQILDLAGQLRGPSSSFSNN